MKVSSGLKYSLFTAVFSSVLTLLVLLLVNYFFNHTWNLFAANSSQPFTVQGTGSITQKPDQSTITFTVTKTATTLSDAQNQANTSMNTLVADLQVLGIAKKDIQTSNYSSSPNYNNTQSGLIPIQRSGTEVVSYTVSEDVTVTLTQVEKANTVIDILTKDGAENIYGPNLSFSQITQNDLMQKARILAIADAKKKAQDLAQAAGIHLGRITNIQENDTGVPVTIRPLMLNTKEGSAGSPTQINPGENTVTATVTLSYTTW